MGGKARSGAHAARGPVERQQGQPFGPSASQPLPHLETLYTGTHLHPKSHPHLHTASEEYLVLRTSLLFIRHFLYICLNLLPRESSPEHRLLLPLGIPARDRQIFEDLPIRLPSTPDSPSQMGSVSTFLTSPADQNVSLSSTEKVRGAERDQISTYWEQKTTSAPKHSPLLPSVPVLNNLNKKRSPLVSLTRLLDRGRQHRGARSHRTVSSVSATFAFGHRCFSHTCTYTQVCPTACPRAFKSCSGYQRDPCRRSCATVLLTSH